ncbi:MAG: hypothetical protein ACLQU1_24165 [Bryobacteraceae bacterium]
MGDIHVENYKKAVTNVLTRWNKALSDIAKELGPIDDEIDKLEKE